MWTIIILMQHKLCYFLFCIKKWYKINKSKVLIGLLYYISYICVFLNVCVLCICSTIYTLWCFKLCLLCSERHTKIHEVIYAIIFPSSYCYKIQKRIKGNREVEIPFCKYIILYIVSHFCKKKTKMYKNCESGILN